MTEEELAAKNPDPCLWPKCPVAEDGINQMRRRKEAEAEVERLEQRSRLEAVVVEAALAEFEANFNRHPGSDCVAHYAANGVWYKARDVFHNAVAALIAFRSEEGDVDA